MSLVTPNIVDAGEHKIVSVDFNDGDPKVFFEPQIRVVTGGFVYLRHCNSELAKRVEEFAGDEQITQVVADNEERWGHR